MKRKKLKKILVITVVLLATIIFVIPAIFEDKLLAIVTKKVNQNLSAQVLYNDADLSFIKSFPNVSLTVKDLSVITAEPFAGDTLAYAKEVSIAVPFSNLFNAKTDPLQIEAFTVSNADVAIIIDELGNENYKIVKPTITENNEQDNPFLFSIDEYEFVNSSFSYKDLKSNITIVVDSIEHTGNAKGSSDLITLATSTEGLFSLQIDSVNYIDANPVSLVADLGLDFKNSTYTFLRNKGYINRLPLVFNGYVTVLDKHQEIAINFKTPTSDFKNFLALLPKEYAKNLQEVTTTGVGEVNGKITGKVTDTLIPNLDINFIAKDASFKYAALPKSVKNINFTAKLVNNTGLAKDTYVAIPEFNFKIDNNSFGGYATFKNLIDDVWVNTALKGTLNLEHLAQVYPVPESYTLKGIVDADLNAVFTKSMVSQNRYEDIKTSGSLLLTNFEYSGQQLPDKLQIANAKLVFTPKLVSLNKLQAKTGNSAFTASGTFTNWLGYMFGKDNLDATLSVNADTFSVYDFVSPNSISEQDNSQRNEIKSTEKEWFTLPKNVNATLKVYAKTVNYDNLTLNNVAGQVKINDKEAVLNSLSAEMFDGELTLSGMLKPTLLAPEFTVNVKTDNFNIAESVKQVSFFQYVAPIAEAFNGKINTAFAISGELNQNLTPNLKTISGNLLAELSALALNNNEHKIIQQLDKALPFADFSNLSLKDVQASLHVNNGKVSVSPFTINYKDINIQVMGEHGLDKSLEYTLVFDVPVKYLGKEAVKLMEQLTPDEAETATVPIEASVSGLLTNPKVSTNAKQAIAMVTQKVINQKKEALKEKTKTKAKDVLSSILDKNTKTDSTKADSLKQNKPVKEAAKKVLKNLFKKKTDTVN